MQQQELIAGDSLNFLTTVEDFPASSGWTLSYRLVPRTAGGTVITFAAVAEGADYRVAISAVSTAAWGADVYSWASWVDKSGESYTVDSGQLVIKPNPRTAVAGYDGRSNAVKALEACEAAMATFNTTGGRVKRYEIAGRVMEFHTLAEILQLRDFWRVKVAAEGASADVSKGLANPRNLFTRFRKVD